MFWRFHCPVEQALKPIFEKRYISFFGIRFRYVYYHEVNHQTKWFLLKRTEALEWDGLNCECLFIHYLCDYITLLKLKFPLRRQEKTDPRECDRGHSGGILRGVTAVYPIPLAVDVKCGDLWEFSGENYCREGEGLFICPQPRQNGLQLLGGSDPKHPMIWRHGRLRSNFYPRKSGGHESCFGWRSRVELLHSEVTVRPCHSYSVIVLPFILKEQ